MKPPTLNSKEPSPDYLIEGPRDEGECLLLADAVLKLLDSQIGLGRHVVNMRAINDREAPMTSSEWTDAELLLESWTTADAFATIYDRHAPGLLTWIKSTLGPDDAPDLLAELFAQAWVARKRFKDPGDGSARPWLFGIGKNLIRTYRRKRIVEDRARRRLGMDLDAHAHADVEDELASRIDAAARRGELNDALDRLPAGQRDAVRLRIVDGLSYPHVAAALDCSEVTARQRVSQGLRALRDRLEESR